MTADGNDKTLSLARLLVGSGAVAPLLLLAACTGDQQAPGGDSAESLPPATPAELVASLDFDEYRSAIETLASFGDRERGSARFDRAAGWLEAELAEAGYTVERHEYEAYSRDAPDRIAKRSNLYVTRIGTTAPDEMIIVAAHLDGIGEGGAADDDGSGCALVLEAARAFARAGFEPERSIRFVFWNGEEGGRIGSSAYVRDRAELQGIESPAGSGRFPEPRWIAMIQHDMLLFDHGLPPGAEQIAAADIDIEYQRNSGFADASHELAEAFLDGNGTFSTDYPAEVGGNMNYTDSTEFIDYTATISVRENQRVAEIGEGANPHWHQPTDLYETYSEADFRLGFNALQMTLGTVAMLAGAP